MTDWPNHLPRQIPCGHCGVSFNATTPSQAKHFKYDGSVSYCSIICREAARQKKYASTHTFGPCPKCGQMFESRIRKIFCSMRCYVTSDEFKKITEKRSKDLRGPRPELQKWSERNCVECDTTFRVKPAKSNKFCSTNCYHSYMAKRFDQHVAAPDKIEIGQCYDEYLSQDEITCPIEGCDWHGEWLTLHIRITHGITAQDFKRAAGFNLNEGIITPALRNLLENRKSKGNSMIMMYARNAKNSDDTVKTDGYVSLQSKETRLKSRALTMNIYGSVELPLTERICDFCKEEFSQLTPFGRTKFCSTKCRSAYYEYRKFLDLTLHCAVCEKAFTPSSSQVRSYAAGHLVVCSNHCRAILNVRKRKTKRG